MSRDLNALKPDFREKVKQLYSNCKREGFILVPFYTERDVYEQARLYRQSRSWKEIKATINQLKIDKAFFLARVIEEVGPQFGLWATNAPPGLSWHQWGEAVDSYLSISGKAIWDSNHEGYSSYHREALKLRLFSFSADVVHIQKRLSKPSYYYSIREIDHIMKEKYEKKERI